MTQVNDLHAEQVWNESTVAEWNDVRHIKKDSSTPMSGLVFLIVGQKSSQESGLIANVLAVLRQSFKAPMCAQLTAHQYGCFTRRSEQTPATWPHLTVPWGWER